MNVKVLSSIMGSGKTSGMLRKMQSEWEEDRERKYIYISVYNDEVGDGNTGKLGRIQKELPDMEFKMPKSRGEGKVNALKELVRRDCNIATTHALLGMFDNTVVNMLIQKRYSIIIDEAIDCIQIYDKLTVGDVQTLLKSGQISVMEDNRVVWNSDQYDYNDTRYTDVRELADSGFLYMYGDYTLVSEYSPKLLKEAESVTILSYLFEGSVMSCWLKIHGIDYTYEKNEDYNLKDENEIKRSIRENLELITHKQLHKQKAGYRDSAFSSTWWKNANSMQRSDIRKYMESVVKTHGVKRGEIFWTCFKDRATNLKGRGYSQPIIVKGDDGKPVIENGEEVRIDPFVPFNIRATNRYKDFTFAMFMVNVYKHPDELGYLKSKGVSLDVDTYALSTCIQWLWRGAIRCNKPMRALIASKRMKKLVEDWINSDERGY